jgi:hypothetical protein
MKITARPEVKLKLVFEIDESEALGLDALVGYNYDSFLNLFKEGMGKAYIERADAQEGLRRFFESCRKEIPQFLSRLDSARKEFNK